MPKFRVMTPVEHDQTLYLPQGGTTSTTAKSVGNGQDIPVDSSGVIELDNNAARTLGNGQIAPLSESAEGRPDSKRTRR